MNLYRHLVYPPLGLFEPEAVHDVTLSALEWTQTAPGGGLLLQLLSGRVPAHPVEVFGIRFPNPLGVAAGFDKDARVVAGLLRLGFGHVEVGTLTPWPQEGNPRPRVHRLPGEGALINRMGFPNRGAEAARTRLRAFRKSNVAGIVGVSLGKQRETSLESASRDYAAVMKVVYPFADYFTLNVSSPNTPNLRQLEHRSRLEELLRVLSERNRGIAKRWGIEARPLLVKISPDLSWHELDEILDVALRGSVSGIVATNTTVRRDGMTHPLRWEEGGVSGTPLRERANRVIAHLHRSGGGRVPIIGVGGVRTADDVREKLDAGASLVQMYTGLVYEGPRIAGRILRTL